MTLILILARIFIIGLIALLIYSGIRYLLHPKRKLELAHEQKKFYFLDDENVRKNFLITYKGVLFEGEKYLGTTKDSFDVVSIFIFPRNVASLKGLTKADFKTIEEHIASHYPKAEIDWKSPIKEFLNNEDNLPEDKIK